MRTLLQNANYDIESAQRGIIYIDEIDKISRKGENMSITRDVSGEGVQQALLKIIEGTVSEVPVTGSRKHPQAETVKIDTSNILFICGGAFDGIDKIIGKEETHNSIGFGANVADKKESVADLSKVEQHDLVKYGLMPELIGRLPIITTLNPLSEEDLVHILTEPKNAITKQYQELLSMDGVKLEFEDEALRKIAELAIKKKTGARGLRSIIESAMQKVMFDVPDMTSAKKVKYIDIRTDDNGQCYVNDTPKEYQTKSISIEHTDGAGMFIPGELPSSCQIRGGYIKGAMFPFDFRLFTHEVSHNSILVDPLVKGFSNNIIGESSNAITKLWNVPELADDPLMYDDMINVICALSNYAIDFPKTGKNLDIGEYQKLYKDLVPPEDIREKFKPQKIKYPQFFKYAKGKKSNLAEYTDSPMDRIAQYIDKTVGSKHYKYEIGTDEEFDYRQLMNNSVDKNGKPLFEVNRSDERYLKAYNVLNSRKKAKQKLCQDIKKEIDRKNTDTKEITAKYDVFHYYCIKEINDIFTDKNGIFNVNLAVNYIIDMEYKSDFYTTSKDILWKCFGNVIVDNLNRNQKTGITLKERPRMCYKKAVRGNDELDQIITNRMERKSVYITQADMNYMGAVLQTKKNGSYYQNDVGLLFALLCHYKYAKQSGRLKEDGSFYITRKKHKTIIKPNGKKKKVDISYNMNKIMEMVGAKSYAGSFTRFMDGGIQIKTDENKISINLDIEEEDNTEVLFTVQDIYNPMIYLQAYNEHKELSECVVCGKHFIKDRNKKTCSGECHDKLHDLQVGKNNRKNKSATIADKKAI